MAADFDGADPPTSPIIPQQLEVPILIAAISVHATLLIALSSRHRRSNHPVLRFVLASLSAAYFPLMSNVLSFMPSYISSNLESMIVDDYEPAVLIWVVDLFGVLPIMMSLIFIQFLKEKADMAALAVAAVTSPVAGDEIDSLKIRPSIESLIYSFWVAGVVIYSIFHYLDKSMILILYMTPLIAPLWILGACRMVLRFTSFQMATRSFALGRNVQLIHGYMAQLQQSGCLEALPEAVPCLIVTGERNEDVKETPLGYDVKRAGEQIPASLITLDRIWSPSGPLQQFPELRDLCLSFALFKCLRRRFAGYQLAEAGSSWAFHFVCSGLLGPEGNHERIFHIIADELSFARGFYYSPLPVASLGGLHFVLSSLIFVLFCFLTLLLVVVVVFTFLFDRGASLFATIPILVLASLLAAVNAATEMSEMVSSMRSNWTKISIIGHYIGSQDRRLHEIFTKLQTRKSSKHWKDEIKQIEMLNPNLFLEQPRRAHLFKQLSLRIMPRKHHHKPTITVPTSVKAAILTSLRSSGGQLSNGTAAVRRRSQAYSHDIIWACCGSEVTTTTEVLLVWHIATSLFEIRCSSQRAPILSSTPTDSTVIAQSLSRYCAYLVAEAPDLLPGDSAWTKLRFKEVHKGIEKASKSGDAVPESGVYGYLVDSFSAEGCHEVLNKGSRLGKQLVEEAERPREGETTAGGQDAVWELLAEFWSEMVLYLAPSDNVKHHIEALQHGGELITLLWALLLHAGITSRPDHRHITPEP